MKHKNPATVSILLVEDDDVDAEGVQRAFLKNKIANPLFHARDGIEALEMLRGENGYEKLSPPYIFLIDINMPRMNGIEFLREIRSDEEFKRTVTFVLTTSKRQEDKMSAYNFNVAGYLLKSKVGADFIEMISMFDRYWKIVEFPAENG